jgi:hypothetical protein
VAVGWKFQAIFAPGSIVMFPSTSVVTGTYGPLSSCSSISVTNLTWNLTPSMPAIVRGRPEASSLAVFSRATPGYVSRTCKREHGPHAAASGQNKTAPLLIRIRARARRKRDRLRSDRLAAKSPARLEVRALASDSANPNRTRAAPELPLILRRFSARAAFATRR